MAYLFDPNPECPELLYEKSSGQSGNPDSSRTKRNRPFPMRCGHHLHFVTVGNYADLVSTGTVGTDMVSIGTVVPIEV